MDYSQVAAEEHSGASPWASSPQHNRTTFGQSSESDVPSSPLPASSQYDNTAQTHQYKGDDDGPFDSHQEAQNAQGSNAQQAHEQPPKQQQAPPQAQQPQQPASQSRYKGRNPKIPQFKLSAKVTGLERTGRKDPIIRFDVAVRQINAIFPLYIKLMLSVRPTSQDSAPPSSATSAVPMPNSSSSPNT
jgi:hypothetical protein